MRWVLKRRIWLISLACAAIACVLFLSLTREREPEYQGRRLSEWLEPLHRISWTTDRDYDNARTAVQSIGTNALPHLIKWISYESPKWRIYLLRKLPSSMINGAIYDWLLRPDMHASYAVSAFSYLGTNAASCIPELEALMNAKKGLPSSRAMIALHSIGEPAMPVFRAALADTSRLDRPDIVWMLADRSAAEGTKTWLPILLEALNDRNALVRATATNYLARHAPEALTNAPPK